MTWPGGAWAHPALKPTSPAFALEEVPLLFLPQEAANCSTEIAGGRTTGSEKRFLSTRAAQATPLSSDTANLMAKTS